MIKDIFGILAIVLVSVINPCSIGQYLDYKSCVCRNSLVDKLVEKCTSVIDGDKIYNKTLSMLSSNDCASCTPYVTLFAVFLSASIVISSAFVYFRWYKNKQLDLKKDVPDVEYLRIETLNVE